MARRGARYLSSEHLSIRNRDKTTDKTAPIATGRLANPPTACRGTHKSRDRDQVSSGNNFIQ